MNLTAATNIDNFSVADNATEKLQNPAKSTIQRRQLVEGMGDCALLYFLGPSGFQEIPFLEEF